MPTCPKKKKHPRDVSKLAFDIVKETTKEKPTKKRTRIIRKPR